MEVLLPNGTRVALSQSDFRAGGGEGDVYVRGATAYKVYHDPAGVLPAAKIGELSALSDPDILKPLDLLREPGGRPVGYAMRAVPGGVPLVQTFSRAFRQREGLTPDKVVALVTKLRAGVQHVHDRGILIVDLNEMNFLLDPGFARLYFIDVDGYQTRSFPARVLMESVRDRHCRGHDWHEGSDWFSFGVVSFQMFTGIHPYRGAHPSVKALDDRMRANLSVLNPAVKVPAATLPFSVIPANFRDWYEAVFERGARVPPPSGPTDTLVLTPVLRVRHQSGSNLFEIVEEAAYGDGVDIVRVLGGGFVLTTEGVYHGSRLLGEVPAGSATTHLALTPARGHAVLAWLDNGLLRLRDATAGRDLPCGLRAEAMTTAAGGRLILKQGDRLQEVEFVESASGGGVLATARHLGNVLEQAARVFDGVVLQNLLGACWASLFPHPFSCCQVRLRELEGCRVVDARAEGTVLMAVAEKRGRYDHVVFRFAPDFARYDARVTPDVTPAGLNFAVLDSGVCAHMNPAEKLELFPAAKGSPALREIDDPAVRGDIRLFHNGNQTLFARGDRLYRISLRRTV